MLLSQSVRVVGVVRIVSEICFLNFHECSYASLDLIFQVFQKHPYTPVQAVHSLSFQVLIKGKKEIQALYPFFPFISFLNSNNNSNNYGK